MKSRLVALGLAALTALPLTFAPVAHAAPPVPEVVPAAQRVFMVADSVGLSAKPAVPGAFPAGWQVTITGQPALFVEQLVSKYVQYQPTSMFGDNAIVAGGYNYPYWDPPRFDRSVDLMVNTLVAKGVKHVYWVTMREVKPAYYSGWNSLTAAYKKLYLAYPTVNDQLRNAMARHPELSIIDWAAISDRTGLSYDAIHLNNTGAAAYAALAASTVVSGLTRKAAGTTTEITVAGQNGVPADATAVSLNLTSFNPRTAGYVTVYPCGGDRPLVSNLNFLAAQTVASAAIVPIGVDGKVCVYQSTAAHVIVDLNGAFGAASGFVNLAPVRALDTRGGAAPAAGVVQVVHLGTQPGAPTGAFTAVINFTVLGGATGAAVTVFNCSLGIPPVPTRIVAPGAVQNLMMVVGTDTNGDVCVIANRAVHVLVDLFGAFPAGADIHPITAQRLLDSRSNGGAIAAGGQRTIQISGAATIPADPAPTGVVLTVAMVGPQGSGWANVFPCGPAMPNTSMVNVVPNHDQTGSVMTATSAAGTVCIYSSVLTHVLVDVSGWAGTAFSPLAPARLLDTRIG